ncbi:heterokaryon incompatibility protein-domain-containing protein [Stachybotrys elegans]|uniref:Heterokaryon incompatibility protein-domain-containing protein n=1 Tax=Stachybotrys elegans TaxID=80388 RepID=A0A8K0WVU4_9HYPO|nr:heterokaryon incompatibility protein-domain-containing protein [Stachybotrys elegans]
MSLDLDQARNSENSFTYPSIDASKQLRLVTLEPVARQGLYAITFHIVSFADLSKTTYHALSYAWGTAGAEDLKLVWVGDQQFWIRGKLFEFIQDALAWSQVGDAATVEFDCSIPIFIDAICINQFDLDEKASQVPKMEDIYRGASHVITYLGQPICSDENMERQVHDMLGSLNSKLDNGPRAVISGGPTTMTPLDVAQIFSFTSWTRDDLYAFGILCRDTYWTRMWVVPEVLLAPQKWTVVLGRQAFDGHLLAGYIPGLVRLEVELSNAEQHGAPILGSEAVLVARSAEDKLHRAIDALQGRHGRNLLDLRHSRNISPRPDRIAGDLMGFSPIDPDDGIPFYQAFTAFGRQDCRYQEDRIYAILPLLKVRARAQIKVSYKLGVWHAFETALRLGWQDLQRDRLWLSVSGGTNIGMAYSGYCSTLLELFRLNALGKEIARSFVRRVAWDLDLRGHWRACQIAFDGRTGSAETVDAWLMILEWGYFHEEIPTILQRLRSDQLPRDSALYRCLVAGSEREVWTRG